MTTSSTAFNWLPEVMGAITERSLRRWDKFQRDVLIPTIVEASLLNASNAQSSRGGSEYKFGREYIHIHNPRSSGWKSIPFYYSALQILSSCNALHKMAVICEAMAKVELRSKVSPEGRSIESIIEFRTEYLDRVYKQNLQNIIENVSIIAGLALVIFSALTPYFALTIGSGTALFIGALIIKLVAKSALPDIERDEKLKSRAQQAAADAEWFMSNVTSCAPHPSYLEMERSQKSAEKNLNQLKEELARDFGIDKTELKFNFSFTPASETPKKNKIGY